MAVVVTKADEQDEIDYDKLCNVFYDKHTSNLHQRQLALLKKVVRTNAAG